MTQNSHDSFPQRSGSIRPGRAGISTLNKAPHVPTPGTISRLRTGLHMALLGLAASGCLLAPLPLHAETKKDDSKLSPEEKAQKLAKEKEAKLNQAVAAHLTYLREFLPKVTEADIRGASVANLRRLYYDAYRAQGIGMAEATSKAEAEITTEKAAETAMPSVRDDKKNKRPDKELTMHFDYLSGYLPQLKLSDLKGINTQDLRKFYCDAYRAQGIGMIEAKKMAAELDLGSEPVKKKEKIPEPEAEEPVVDANYEYLKSYLPLLKPEDLRNKSDSDLRRLYYDAYRAQGISPSEALQTSQRLIVIDLTEGQDPYSLQPGQIPSSPKTGVRKIVEKKTKK